MPDIDGVDVMTEACIRAHELVKEHGTPEMRVLMDLLLLQIGREIARREIEQQEESASS